MMRVFLLLLLSTVYSGNAYAYLDPASGNALATFFVAVFGSTVYFFKTLYYKIFARSNYKAQSVIGNKDKDSATDSPFIFSEGKMYWGTFRPIVEEFIRRKIHFRYITLDIHDPGLTIDSQYMDSKRITKGKLGFAKIAELESPVMLSTTPNIGSEGYPMPRPVGVKNLVHVFHALVDVSCYRKGSLDFYDSVLLVGEHEIESIRLVEAARGLSAKELIVAGLPCMDDLGRQKPELEATGLSEVDTFKTVLVAPSWGAKGCFTEYGTDFVKILSRAGYKVIIRLHPHSFIFEPESVARWRLETEGLENVSWDHEAQGTNAMSQADVLISDASSIRFDFAFLYEKPVVSLEIPAESRSIFESDYMGFTWADTMVEKIGVRVNSENLNDIDEIVGNAITSFTTESLGDLRNRYVANFGRSATAVVDYLEQQADLLSLTTEQLISRRRIEELEWQVVELRNRLSQVDQTGQLSQLNFVPSEQHS
ncbi:MAG: hypothetical protein ACJA2D_001765 [Pseudohongiellaceae bacterium]|jgi:hypothetical protein